MWTFNFHADHLYETASQSLLQIPSPDDPSASSSPSPSSSTTEEHHNGAHTDADMLKATSAGIRAAVEKLGIGSHVSSNAVSVTETELKKKEEEQNEALPTASPAPVDNFAPVVAASVETQENGGSDPVAAESGKNKESVKVQDGEKKKQEESRASGYEKQKTLDSEAASRKEEGSSGAKSEESSTDSSVKQDSKVESKDNSGSGGGAGVDAISKPTSVPSTAPSVVIKAEAAVVTDSPPTPPPPPPPSEAPAVADDKVSLIQALSKKINQVKAESAPEKSSEKAAEKVTEKAPEKAPEKAVEQKATVSEPAAAIEPVFGVDVPARLEMWTGGELPDGYSVCRITNVLVDRAPSKPFRMDFPAELRDIPDIQSKLSSCGVSKPTFAEVKASAPLLEVDLIQPFPVARHHMPHFVDDIKDFLPSFGAVLNDPKLVKYTYSCDSKDGACNKDRKDALGKLAPAAAFEEKARSPSKGAWARSLLNSMARAVSPEDEMRYVYEGDLTTDPSTSSHGGVRVRSVVLGPKLMPMRLTADAIANHAMYVNNGLIGRARPSKCKNDKIVVLVIDRNGTREGNRPFTGGRYLTQQQELVDLAKKTVEAYCSSGPMCTVKVNVAYYEKISFKEQIELVNEADVVLAVHGAALANAMFMRRNSLLHEVMPFGYKAPLFGGIARAFGSDWSGTMADPMFGIVSECMNHVNPGEDQAKPLKDWYGLFNKTADVFETESAKLLKTSGIVARGHPGVATWGFYDLKKSAKIYTRLKMIMPCLRVQPLRANFEHVRASILDWLPRRCQGVGGGNSDQDPDDVDELA